MMEQTYLTIMAFTNPATRVFGLIQVSRFLLKYWCLTHQTADNIFVGNKQDPINLPHVVSVHTCSTYWYISFDNIKPLHQICWSACGDKGETPYNQNGPQFGIFTRVSPWTLGCFYSLTRLVDIVDRFYQMQLVSGDWYEPSTCQWIANKRLCLLGNPKNALHTHAEVFDLVR